MIDGACRRGKIASGPPTGAGSSTLHSFSPMTQPLRSVTRLAALALALGACQTVGNLLRDENKPPMALDRLQAASDARIDSAGGLRGSFVGEGTSRAVHLVSTDTGFIASMIRRYRPDAIRSGDLWGSLSRAGTVTIDPSVIRSTGSGGYRPLVASPEGHTDVQLSGVIARGGSCGWRGAQAELIVQAPPASAEVPSLRGPVVGSFRLSSEVSDRQIRAAPLPPSSDLIASLVDRTARAMDSMLERRLGASERPLTPVDREPLPINSLLDVDAADILPIRTRNNLIHHAVSLRHRRITGLGDTVVAAGVMIWDNTGTWQQTVFQPTLLDFRRGRILPRRGEWTPVFWRRLQAVSAFEYPRDYIWMEQVHPMDGSVLWGIIDPSGNVVVAAAEMSGPCTQ